MTAARIARNIVKSVIAKETAEGDGARGKDFFMQKRKKENIN